VECTRITQEASLALTDFRDAQEKISEDIKSTIQRQAFLIQGEQVSQREVEELVLHPEKGQEMLRDRLLDSPSVQLENSVSDIIDKCNDVLKLEKVAVGELRVCGSAWA
jgi:t-SNARE complex subunit (syntaxin)